MKEGDPLSLRSDSRDFVHQRHAGVATFREHRVEIVDGQAQVVNAGAAFFNEARDR